MEDISSSTSFNKKITTKTSKTNLSQKKNKKIKKKDELCGICELEEEQEENDFDTKLMILCDGCDRPFHLKCLGSALSFSFIYMKKFYSLSFYFFFCFFRS